MTLKSLDLIKNNDCNSSYNKFIYVVGNESPLQEKTLVNLQSMGFAGLGTSCLSSLNLFSHRENITAIYIVDVSEKVMRFWEKLIPILKNNSDKDKTLNEIKNLITTNKQSYFAARAENNIKNSLKHTSVQAVFENTLDVLHYEYAHNLSFLSTPIRYERIHVIAKNGNIRLIRADLRNPAHTTLLVEHLKENRFDTVYASNIIDSFQEENKKTVQLFFSQIRKLNQPPFQSAHLVFATDIQSFLRQQIQNGSSEKLPSFRKASFIGLSILILLVAVLHTNYKKENPPTT